MMHIGRIGATALLALGLVACGNDDIDQSLMNGTSPAPAASGAAGSSAPATAAPAAETTTASTPETTATAGGDVLTLSVTNDPAAPRYSQGVLSAPVGSTIRIEYVNPDAEQHNWVLVEPGQEQAVVDATAGQNGDPADLPGVIAWSETIASGSTTVDVPPLPESGGYVYLCTVPGHYAAGHKGALNVR